ncbi:MAG: DUF2304 domain-containing protein [Candidatus Aminicenantia bacterium]
MEVEVVRIQIIGIIGSILLIFFVLELIRRGRLKIEFSLLWFFISVLFLFVSVFRGLLDKFSYFVGIGYPPSALFLILLLGSIMVLIHFSVVISDLKETKKILTQKIGLMEMEIERLKKELEECKG